jgi:hypothetical protein
MEDVALEKNSTRSAKIRYLKHQIQTGRFPVLNKNKKDIKFMTACEKMAKKMEKLACFID